MGATFNFQILDMDAINDGLIVRLSCLYVILCETNSFCNCYSVLTLKHESSIGDGSESVVFGRSNAILNSKSSAKLGSQ